jgi:hypothetical protein
MSTIARFLHNQSTDGDYQPYGLTALYSQKEVLAEAE